MSETVHLCPQDDGGPTPCCGRTPFELPTVVRMTEDPAYVTCTAGDAEGTAP